MKVLSALLVLALAVTSSEVWAKRLGGGGSLGKQSTNVSQRSTTPDGVVGGAQAPAAAPSVSPAKAPAASASAAAAPNKPWGAMLGGLAAGLGLAWLASSLGLGDGFAQMLMWLLLTVATVALVRWLMRSRAAPQSAAQGDLAFQAAGVPAPEVPPSYSPSNVGNDASARPWERNTTSFDVGRSQAAAGSIIGSALSGSSGWRIPEGFDAEGFLRASRTNFINLQAAWDCGDVATLRAMMTDDMLTQTQTQLAERERQAPGAVNTTTVDMLEARLLGIEETADEYMASVEFSGLVREDAAAGPNPFREVWNVTRPKQGQGGWLVAGVQALQ